ncbi:VOC family protein [Microbacterium aurum]
MTDLPDAFDISPVPAPGPDAVAPPLFRGIYGMPMFVTIPTADLAASIDFWTRGLGCRPIGIRTFTSPERISWRAATTRPRSSSSASTS